MKYKLSNLIDMEKSQKLLDSFCDVVGIAAAIIDLEGEVLVGSRWQQICTDFHRINKRTCKKCIESDTQLANELQQGKHFSIYQCRNGLTDAASPIIIEDEHIANTFVGQFLLKTPDRDFFRQQAATYGFEETHYLDALSKVPIVKKENLPAILNFLTTFAEMVAIMGIDRLKQIETAEALQESEEQYRTLVYNLPVAVYRNTPGPEGKFLMANPAFCKMFEFKDEEEVKYVTPASLYRNPKERKQYSDNLIQNGLIENDERTLLKKDGTPVQTSITSRVVYDEDGEVSHFDSFMLDITEQKQAERDLLESEERFRFLVEESPLAIALIKKGGQYKYLNPMFVDMFGYTIEDIPTGREWFRKAFPNESYRKHVISAWIKDLKKHETGTSRLRTFSVSCKDGSEKSVQFRPVTMTTNDHFVICDDITERKHIEEALRASEEKYRTILESMEDGYFEVDIAGNLTFFNDSLCEILGYSNDELMGMNNRQYTDEESAKSLYQTFNRVYATGKPDKSFHWPVIRKDGAIKMVDASVSLRRDTEGEPIGFRGIVRDISEEQRLEAQLQHAQRMESIGTLAGGIAHNFNNLLMGIMGYASLMLLETDSDHPNHKRLKNIEKQVESGSKLTSQLLGYAREGSYEVKPISLNQLVKETSDTFGMTKRETMVHQELSEKLYCIKADQGQIEQVLLNLYVNAADAMPGGGDLFLKTVNVADKDMTGKPYKVKPRNYVLLTVKDTGVGMDEETKERIFEPFFTTKGLASGTGLGMASAYGIIKGHGGYIDVDSKKGEGTTFSIYLPATEKDLEEKKVSFDGLVKGKGTVLLVDDEEMVLDSGGQMLKHLGYEVLLAGDGRNAVELYRKNQDKIDLVLLDMVMPVLGGGKTFDRMKEINSGVKVLLSSGYSIEGEAKEILKRGCDAFIQKPFKLEQLSQKIGEILDKK